METEIRFHTVSEDLVGELQSQTIGAVADKEMLYYGINNALKNDLRWR